MFTYSSDSLTTLQAFVAMMIGPMSVVYVTGQDFGKGVTVTSAGFAARGQVLQPTLVWTPAAPNPGILASDFLAAFPGALLLDSSMIPFNVTLNGA